MKIVIKPLQKDQALDVITWQYEPPYNVYNFNHREEELTYLLEPRHAFHALLNDSGGLEGFCSFGADGQVTGGNYHAEALDIGMGLRPALTGQGRGLDYAKAVLEYALTTYQPQKLRVTIMSFNWRARRVWEHLGFKFYDEFKTRAERAFVVLLRDL
jgi:[ribosomal protein S18]-alanine N-acetyltransferase